MDNLIIGRGVNSLSNCREVVHSTIIGGFARPSPALLVRKQEERQASKLVFCL